MQILFLILVSMICLCCKENSAPTNSIAAVNQVFEDSMIVNINPPAGYHRSAQPAGSFGEWLRMIRLKKDRKVYLYNGRLKSNQDAQFAVLDIPVGNKDLQQ